MGINQYLEDKRSHELYCNDGEMLIINEFTGEEKYVPCPRCEKVKELAKRKQMEKVNGKG